MIYSLNQHLCPFRNSGLRCSKNWNQSQRTWAIF